MEHELHLLGFGCFDDLAGDALAEPSAPFWGERGVGVPRFRRESGSTLTSELVGYLP